MYDSSEIVVRVAADPGELNAVYRLRYDAYLLKGYISPDPSGMKRDDWEELPHTMHFVALVQDKVVGAVRLVLDSQSGLPMEREFAREIGLLKAQGRKVAEASTLVVTPDYPNSGPRVWLGLSRAVWQEAQAQAVDDLCIAVTQNHLGLYRRLLFEVIGPGRPYHTLNGVFAYPLRLRVEAVRVTSLSRYVSRMFVTA